MSGHLSALVLSAATRHAPVGVTNSPSAPGSCVGTPASHRQHTVAGGGHGSGPCAAPQAPLDPWGAATPPPPRTANTPTPRRRRRCPRWSPRRPPRGSARAPRAPRARRLPPRQRGEGSKRLVANAGVESRRLQHGADLGVVSERLGLWANFRDDEARRGDARALGAEDVEAVPDEVVERRELGLKGGDGNAEVEERGDEHVAGDAGDVGVHKKGLAVTGATLQGGLRGA